MTETDQEVEKLLISGLGAKFPDTRFIGEESVAAGSGCVLTEEPTWIIDPIDGTTNFVSSNPNMCTILGFMVNKVALEKCNWMDFNVCLNVGSRVWYRLQSDS